jgi:hypothetical protein
MSKRTVLYRRTVDLRMSGWMDERAPTLILNATGLVYRTGSDSDPMVNVVVSSGSHMSLPSEGTCGCQDTER